MCVCIDRGCAAVGTAMPSIYCAGRDGWGEWTRKARV